MKKILSILLFSILFSSSILSAQNRGGNLGGFIASSKIEKKIKLLREEIVKQPNNAELWNKLAYYYEKKGLLQDALNCYFRAILINKNHVPAHYGAGNTLFKMAKFKQAIPYFKKLIKLKPKLWKGYYGIGLTYKVLEQLNLAVTNFELVQKYNPYQLDTYYFIAQCYESLRIFGKALKKYKQFIKIASRLKKKRLYYPFIKKAIQRIRAIQNKAKNI